MIELYGKHWTDPTPIKITETVAANGDADMIYVLAGRRALIWNAHIVNLTRNNLKQNWQLCDNDTPNDSQVHTMDETQQQTDDSGSRWTYGHPILVAGIYGLRFLTQDCLQNDVLQGEFYISMEIL